MQDYAVFKVLPYRPRLSSPHHACRRRAFCFGMQVLKQMVPVRNAHTTSLHLLQTLILLLSTSTRCIQ